MSSTVRDSGTRSGETRPLMRRNKYVSQKSFRASTHVVRKSSEFDDQMRIDVWWNDAETRPLNPSELPVKKQNNPSQLEKRNVTRSSQASARELLNIWLRKQETRRELITIRSN
ncbi:hypothetical protein FF1_004861 [Malus domestica]